MCAVTPRENDTPFSLLLWQIKAIKTDNLIILKHKLNFHRQSHGTHYKFRWISVCIIVGRPQHVSYSRPRRSNLRPPPLFPIPLLLGVSTPYAIRLVSLKRGFAFCIDRTNARPPRWIFSYLFIRWYIYITRLHDNYNIRVVSKYAYWGVA